MEIGCRMQTPDYKTVFIFIGAFLMTALVFSASLATIITLLFFGGIPILQKGIPMCGVLMQNNMLDRILYTSCGCALVELILLPLAALGLRIFTPKLLAQFRFVAQHRPKKLK
ncbi:MAG: hypothetical protein K0Q50_834 [Vampirovibrio sp.]|jgi:hypothetical protein|nr:hypothetical protein [Vampirovibrio sp.]